jgi:hypothetical protein
MTRIEDIEARLAAATPGPWHYDGMHDEITTEVAGNYWLIMSECRSAPNEAPRDEFGHQFSPDFELIANAPADLRWLLDRERALRDALRNFARESTDLEGLEPGRLFFLSVGEILEARAALSEEAAG